MDLPFFYRNLRTWQFSAIAGVGSAGIFIGSLVILSQSVRLERRPFFTGLNGSMYGIASVVGPVLGGVFANK
ncbi:hypothetical protein J3459_011231 [Metarhizium acridum]|nr:hypothetical protein J3459_011231 [Metarhizium acridum]